MNMQKASTLKGYFTYHLEVLKSKPFSVQSGKRIYTPSSVNICHILPKRKYGFPSLATVIENCNYLTWEEHARFDNLFDTQRFDKLEEEFDKAWIGKLPIIQKLMEICTDKGKLFCNLEEYLNRRVSICG